MAQSEISFTGPIMPFELLKKQKISLGAKNVFALIAAFRRHGRRCFAQTRWFADQLGVSESSVRNYIKSLIEAGLIERDGDGCYHVIWEALGLQKEDNNSDEKEKFCTGDRKICGIYNNINTEPKRHPSPSPVPAVPPAPVARDASSLRDAGEAEKAFTQVWAAYPRPPRFVSREKAWREFRRQWKQGTLPKLEVILAAIKLNREQNPAWSRGNENGRYIPNLETWLSGRRWADDFAGAPITSPPPSAEEIALAEQVAAIQKHTEEWGNVSPKQVREFQELEGRLGLEDKSKRSMAFGLYRFLKSRGVSLHPEMGGDLLTFLKNAAYIA